ncbi:replication factor A [Methanolobus bombayensis]|uniref:replication factor A n=1 Tax=Methanolobus bombayensis TaxID=38023 RepID=UPI001AEB48A2|nr:replication factor A [Methanolobus bombayensis]MBP1909246.1 replication factor A1 [Methanolobus bombayensis]
MKELAHEISARFSELGVEIPIGEIEERLDKMINKFKVPKDEARRSVVNYFLKSYNIKRNEFYTGQSESPLINISDVDDGKWANIRGKIVQLWDNTHESISQVGLIGDETGTIKFTIWESAGLPQVDEGKSYFLKNIVVNEWNGKFQINVNKSSSIESLDEDIEVGNATVEFKGAMVDIQSGSGLIKRCPECNRALTKGACMEHGKVDGVYDLRIKAVMDDGSSIQDAILKKEQVEEITGTTLENAIAMAADALDQGVVLEKMKDSLEGRYYLVTGSRVDRYLIVESISPIFEYDSSELDELIAAAEVI